MTGIPLVLVNHCHPEMPHVCAVRLRSFAEALAKRGHRVVLLTESLDRLDASPPPGAVARDLAGHDWGRPYVLPCAPTPAPLVARARVGGLPAVLNKGVLAASYVLRGGLFGDWVAGSRPYWRLLAETVRPGATWGTFGNTGAWIIARGIARMSGCPWVMDIKDSWAYFVPRGLRRAIAGRFADAAAVTALSRFYADEAKRWFGRPATVVYSGIPSDFAHARAGDRETAEVLLTLTGSVYDRRRLDDLFAGLASWLDGVDAAERGRVTLAYFGADEAAVGAAAARLAGLCRVEIKGFRPLDELYAALGRARLNMYMRDRRGPFHHKIFELLSADRPILCLPEEEDEALAIVAEVGGRFFSCAGPAEVRAGLAAAWRLGAAPGGASWERLRRYTWDAQAEILETVFEDAIAGRAR